MLQNKKKIIKSFDISIIFLLNTCAHDESLSRKLQNVRILCILPFFFYDNTNRPHSAFLTMDRTE